jgi:hypothetical protein
VPGSKVDLADGATVAIAPNQTIALDPHSTVAVAAPSISENLRPTRNQLQANANDNLACISTTYTTFHSQQYREGRIESAWSYTISDVNKPIAQTCSYIAAQDDRHDYRVVIAKDGTATSSIKSIPGFDYGEALQKCVWNDHVS